MRPQFRHVQVCKGLQRRCVSVQYVLSERNVGSSHWTVSCGLCVCLTVECPNQCNHRGDCVFQEDLHLEVAYPPVGPAAAFEGDKVHMLHGVASTTSDCAMCVCLCVCVSVCVCVCVDESSVQQRGQSTKSECVCASLAGRRDWGLARCKCPSFSARIVAYVSPSHFDKGDHCTSCLLSMCGVDCRTMPIG
jgi:hypothetical protein